MKTTDRNANVKGKATMERKPSAGLLLIASPRFRNLGEGTERGPYRVRKEADAERRRKAFAKSMTVCLPGIVYESDDLHRAIAQFRSENVDFVYAEFLSWSEDAAWIEFLRENIDAPVLFAHVVREKPGFSSTEDEDDFIEFLSAGGLVGTLEASGSIGRASSKQVSCVVGDLGKVTEEAAAFGRAAATRSKLRKAKLGLLGSYNELMWSTYMDPYGVFAKLGPKIHFISYSDYAMETDKVSDTDAKDYVKSLRKRHETLPDVEDGKFMASARASLALARIASQMKLDILSLNDVDHALFRAVGLRPGFYPEWFNVNGSVMVPEGDVGAGVAAYLLKSISGGTVNFIEPFHIDKPANCFAAGHAGPNDHTDPAAAKRVKIARDVRFAKTSYKFAGAPFAWQRFAPGAKTMLHVSQGPDGFKMICSMLDSLDGPHLFASYSHGLFRPRIPMEDFFRRIIEIGATQHYVIADGDWREDLKRLAAMTGMDFHNIE